MAVYVVADIRVTNPVAYDQYPPLAAASITRHGGRFIVRGGKSTCSKASPNVNGSS